MELQAPDTLLRAWIVVPALVALTAAGIGYGAGLVSGMRLGALTLPVGYLAGIALSALLFEAGVVGAPVALLLAGLALAGPAYAWRAGLLRRGTGDRGDLLWPGLAALAAYAVAMAPLAGSGRSGVLGYVFNDDSAIHVALVQAISDGISEPTSIQRDSYHFTTYELGTGYPVGSYAWPVFGRLAGGIDPFHLWTPLSALTLAMLALVAYAMLRRLGAPRLYGAAASVLVPAGHLVYAYHAQGGTKEVVMPVAVYATAALLACAFDERLRPRALVPAAIAAAAAVANLGYAAAAWIGPMALAAAALVAWRSRRGAGVGSVRKLALVAAAALVVMLPAAISSIAFFRRAGDKLTDPNETGNLIDALSPWQILNVWLTSDYRFKPPDAPAFTYTALGLALALAVGGIVHAWRRRELALPLALVAGVAGAVLVSSRTSIYFDAKTYVALAPAAAIATAAGPLLALARGTAARAATIAAAACVAAGVLASALTTYANVWVTPEERLSELRSIGERYRDRADRTLVAEREQYALHLLRELGPWDDWGLRQPERRLRVNSVLPPDRAPDLDDYELAHVRQFALLVERKAPGGSRAPANYRGVLETKHYRVWERTAPSPREHVPFGSDGRAGSARVACRAGTPVDARLRALARRAEAARSPLVVAVHPSPAVTVLDVEHWLELDARRAVGPAGLRAGRGGFASAPADVARGRYDVWIQGSFGPGVRVSVGRPGERAGVNVGDAFNDLGTPGWHRVGSVAVGPDSVLRAYGIDRPVLLAGSDHFNIVGPTKLVPEAAPPRVETLAPDDLRRLCGRHLDWAEIPA